MTTVNSASISMSTKGDDESEKTLVEFRAFWGHFFGWAFNPYRPEQHYMRGPGPAWRAKQVARSI